MSDSKSRTYQMAGTVATARTSHGHARRRGPSAVCSVMRRIPFRSGSRGTRRARSGGPILDVRYITECVFCEDLRLDATPARADADPHQDAPAELADWLCDAPVDPDPPGLSPLEVLV